MLTGLLCAIFKGRDDQTENMSCILDSLIPILSEEEIGIMEESALAAFVMRKNLEASKTNDTENDVSKHFGDIASNTLQ